MLFARIQTVWIITHFSLALVPLAFVLFVRPCRLSVRAQALWTMALLLAGSKGVVYGALGGNVMAPDLPEALVWIWNWADNTLLFLVVLSVVWWVRRGRVVLLPLVAAGLAAWGQFAGSVAPSIHEVEIASPRVPVALDGYRIVQISDLHCSSSARRWRTQAVVDRVNALKADLVCLTGDYVDGKVSHLGDDLRPLVDLRAKDGVWGVRGNHEYYLDADAWHAWFDAHGLRMLENECVYPRTGLALGGVNDRRAAVHRSDLAPNVRAAFAAATNGEFRVLMEHRPDGARVNLTDLGVDLQLSGHTHGGVAPLLDRVVARANRGFVRGLYEIGGRWLYVSPGTGQWVGFPMRFFNPSEVTVFTLRRKF